MRLTELLAPLTEAGAKPIYYFAYGMLTDPNNMESANLVGVATLPNYTFEMLQFANVVATPGSKVYGCLWEIDRDLLAQLDRTEGYPIFYDRKTVPVLCNGTRYEAELYTMTPASREDLLGTIQIGRAHV